MKQKNEYKHFLKRVSSELTCSKELKHVFLNDLKEKLMDFFSENQEAGMDDAIDYYGTPKEIASSFENHKDLSYFKEVARRYKITRIITFIVLSLIIAVITFQVIVCIINGCTIDWEWFLFWKE